MSASFFPRLSWALASLVPVSVFAHETPHTAPGEYFFGEDPGVGLATPIPTDDSPEALEDLDTLTLPVPASPGAGLVFGVRFRNDAGAWGATGFRHVFLLQTASVVDVSWTWDITFPPSANTGTPADGTLSFSRPVASDPDAPADRLALRPAANGLVGHTVFRQVSPFGGSSPTRLYYAVDASPDPATAASIALTEAHLLAPTALALDVGTLTPGFHSLHLQPHDDRGAHTESVRFLHVTPSTVETLTGLAYSFTNAAGDTTPIEVAALTASEDPQEVVLTAPQAPLPSKHTLVLNLLDPNHDAGLATSHQLRISTPFHEWVRTALPGRPRADTALLADPDDDRIVNLLEFAFGFDPLTANVAPPYTLETRQTKTGSKRFLLTYRQREGGTGDPGVDYTAHGLVYVVETSTDMKTWRPFSVARGVSGEHTRATNLDGTETVSMTLFVDEALDSNRTIFARLTVKLAK